ncbi:MAG TPA: serine/threonine-protein kinase [Pseudobdellovibrionaceae bacterium]|nr:serine/threonine-protein kinase [Pseudobdellovibrionaceae bacterium]
MSSQLPQIGQKIGDYRIQAELGRGGMGVVYLCEDEVLKRPAAVKVLSFQDMGGHDAVKRFLLEGRALARLQHPHIVSVYSLGEADGYAFLAMEFIEGCSLHQLSRRRVLSPSDCVRIFKELASGLQHAHDSGIVHRDIKPGNILIDKHGHAKLIDFGIAKFRQGEDDSGFRTETGILIGTLNYIAPELFRGEAPSARSDLYSLGLVLYEMLVGRTPFKGQNRFETMEMIKSGVLPVSTALKAMVPAAVWKLIKQCVLANPEERPTDMAAAARLADQVLQQLAASSPADAAAKFDLANLFSHVQNWSEAGDWLKAQGVSSEEYPLVFAMAAQTKAAQKSDRIDLHALNDLLPIYKKNVDVRVRQQPGTPAVNSTHFQKRNWLRRIAWTSGAALGLMAVGLVAVRSLKPEWLASPVVPVAVAPTPVAKNDRDPASNVEGPGHQMPARGMGSPRGRNFPLGVITEGEIRAEFPEVASPNPRLGRQSVYINTSFQAQGGKTWFRERRTLEAFEGRWLKWKIEILHEKPGDPPAQTFYWWMENNEAAIPRATRGCPILGDSESQEAENSPSQQIYPLRLGRAVAIMTHSISQEFNQRQVSRVRRCKVREREKLSLPWGESWAIPIECGVAMRDAPEGMSKTFVKYVDPERGELVRIQRSNSHGLYGGPYGSEYLIESFKEGEGEAYADYIAKGQLNPLRLETSPAQLK